MFPGGRKNSAGEAGTSKRPRPGKRSLTARGERSERPVAGTDAAAQADLAGRHAARTAGPLMRPGNWTTVAEAAVMVLHAAATDKVVPVRASRRTTRKGTVAVRPHRAALPRPSRRVGRVVLAFRGPRVVAFRSRPGPTRPVRYRDRGASLSRRVMKLWLTPSLPPSQVIISGGLRQPLTGTAALGL